MSTDLEALEFERFFDVGFTKCKGSQILHNKIGHLFLVMTKLVSIWNIALVSKLSIS